MVNFNTDSKNIRLKVLLCLTAVLVLMGQPATATAADGASNNFKPILKNTVEDLWTGREFKQKLILRQNVLKTMLATGDVKKPELENMLEMAFFAMLNRHQTSRYILKVMPERVNALFSPHMNWEEVQKIMWRALSSVLKKDDPIVFKAGTLAPPGTPWINVAETILFPKINMLSDGKIQLKIYGGGAMGEDTDILQKMGDGQLDSCGCTAIGLLEAFPDIAALLLPGLFNNYEEVDYIFKKFRKQLDEGFEENGYILASLIDTGYFYLFSKSGKTCLTDVRSQKVLTWFGIIETSLYQELGINSVSVTVSDIVSALNTSLADSVLAPAAWMLGMQAYQHSCYYLKPPLFYSPGAVLVSTRAKDRLQKQAGVSATFAWNIQEIIVSEFNAIEPEWKSQIRSYEEISLKAFETKCGIQAITLGAEDQQAIEKAGKSVQQKLAGKVFPTDLTNDIQQALEEYRTAH